MAWPPQYSVRAARSDVPGDMGEEPKISLKRLAAGDAGRSHYRVLLSDGGKARRIGWIVDRAHAGQPPQWACVVRGPGVSRLGPPTILMGASPEALRDEIQQMYAVWSESRDV